MSTISELVEDFTQRERPVGTIIDEENVKAQCLAAVRFYAGFCFLKTFRADIGSDEEEPHREVSHFSLITEDTEISTGEWALIRPLFLLYVERENALQLEASRGLGADPYGRGSSEVQQDISNYEQNMSRLAFCEPVITNV